MELIREALFNGKVRDVYEFVRDEFLSEWNLNDYPDFVCLFERSSKGYRQPTDGAKQLSRLLKINVEVQDAADYFSDETIVSGDFAEIEFIPKGNQCIAKLFAETDPQKWFGPNKEVLELPVKFGLDCLIAFWSEVSSRWNDEITGVVQEAVETGNLDSDLAPVMRAMLRWEQKKANSTLKQPVTVKRKDHDREKLKDDLVRLYEQNKTQQACASTLSVSVTTIKNLTIEIEKERGLILKWK